MITAAKVLFGVFQLWIFATVFSYPKTTRLSRLENEAVNSLVNQWAPLVWLAPDEKFMPLDVKEFLYHVHAEHYDAPIKPGSYNKVNADDLPPKENKWKNKMLEKMMKNDGNFISGLPVGEFSEKSYLVTNSEVDELLDDPNSFLYGKNPNNAAVPVYAVIRICSSPAEYPEEVVYDSTPPKISFIPLTSQMRNASNDSLSNEQTRSPRKAVYVEDFKNYNKSDDKQDQINEIVRETSEFMANIVDNVKFTPDKINGPNLLNGKSKNIPQFHVTYWMFYPYSQGKALCTLNLGPLGRVPIPAVFGMCLGSRKDIGSHVGDWEHMSLSFTGDLEPEYMYVSAHDAGAYYIYNKLTGTFEFKSQETRKGILQRPNFPKTVTTSQNHPVLFAAQGSHGLWTAPGKHRFVRVARLYDVNGFGTPWYTWKNIQINYQNLRSQRSMSPSWLHFKGKWGNPKSKCHPFRRIGINFCEYSDGPTGIPLKKSHFQCGSSSIS